MSCEGELTQQLSEQGFRITPQRRVILHILLHANTHLTAAEVYEEACTKLPGLTEPTVYRTLDFLAKTGLAQEAFSQNSKIAYEISRSEHHHLICRQCGTEVDIPHSKTEALFAQLETESGFQLMQNHLSFFGICPACQN